MWRKSERLLKVLISIANNEKLELYPLNFFIIILMTKTVLDNTAATKACLNFGMEWRVSKTTPEALICTKESTHPGDNCDTCDTWRLLVLKDGGYDTAIGPHSYPFPVSTVSGSYYGGHSPCVSGDNFPYCGKWIYWIQTGMSLEVHRIKTCTCFNIYFYYENILSYF